MLQIRLTDTDTWHRASAINLLDTDPDTDSDPDNEIWNSSLTQEFHKDIVTKIAA